MKIPPVQERESFYWDLIQRCFASREERIPIYRQLRSYYLYGAEEGRSSVFNKINSHIDQVTSFLFAADTTRFSVYLKAQSDKRQMSKVRVLSARVNEEWNDSNLDNVFGQALTWALVYNCTFVKLGWMGDGIAPYLVEPHQIGVYREDTSGIDRQEAICMRFAITRSELAQRLEGHPNLERIVDSVGPAQASDTMYPESVRTLILSTVQPTMTGVVDWIKGQDLYRPHMKTELAQMYELWVWDDDLDDYRTVTMGDPGVTVFDRRNLLGLPGEHPFVQVCPNPLYNYFFGESEVAKLTQLQDARTRRWEQVTRLLDKQVDPPKWATGMAGITEEKLLALNLPGSSLFSPDPMGKVQAMAPDVPTDVLNEIREIDLMFSEASGISNVMQGRGELGVRSKGQTTELAKLGSSRIKKRSMIIEDALEKISTLVLKLIQRHDPESMVDEDGVKFIAEQFDDNFIVKVDAHSNSPIFVEDLQNMAFALLEARAITREALIEMLQPSNAQLLIEDLKKIEAGEAQAAAAQMGMEREALRLKAVRSA